MGQRLGREPIAPMSRDAQGAPLARDLRRLGIACDASVISTLACSPEDKQAKCDMLDAYAIASPLPHHPFLRVHPHRRAGGHARSLQALRQGKR